MPITPRMLHAPHSTIADKSEPEIITFGCRLNSYESEVMRGHARHAGLTMS